ncbi:hypothetical protein H8356DRAFT_1723494 [Neocallimastix lanati (nom. inval.)]|nr:hypothetical protein H8356DRAFT_1723494 [Neocallimastix sp. JGI-2020a]
MKKSNVRNTNKFINNLFTFLSYYNLFNLIFIYSFNNIVILFNFIFIYTLNNYIYFI